MSDTTQEIKADLADVRSRIIYHAKHGRRALKLRKAYARLKAKAAKARRVERTERSKLWVSPHFSLAEFACHDGTPVPAKAIPALRVHAKVLLEPMRARFGRCTVLSGYRHRAYNARIGGATSSFHIYDIHPEAPATDLKFAQGTPAEWAAYARKLGAGGVGTYPQSGFVHLDRGPRRDWRG